MRDPDLRRFIDVMIGEHPFREVRQACERRFGAGRTPSIQSICRYWLLDPSHKGVRRPGVRSKIYLNEDLRHLIETHKEGLTFFSLAQLCQEKFGRDAPSASAINRYWLRTHGRARRKRGSVMKHSDAV